MPQAKAIALAVTQPNPLREALESGYNCLYLIGDLMYGTPERTRLTYIFAAALFLLGLSMDASAANTAQVCPA